ncbi:MAG TPA: DNA primase [Clostridiales bacterium]|nr:DNA primase [Clostridiales bacterium]
MLKALNIPVEEFLKPLFDAGETVCVRVFADRKGSAFKGLKLEYPAGKISAAVENLKKHNEQNRGIFFVINYGGHEDSEITRINAQFVESDSLSIEEQMAKIEAFPLPPSMIVRTKKSLHTYWLIKGGDVSKFRTIQKRLIAQFDGDKTCINESRVLRLPGFEHRKGDPFMVECIKFNPELRYTQAELEAVLPAIADEVPNAMNNTPSGTRKGLILVGRRCEFIQHCKNNAASLSEHDWYSMITNLAVFEGGDKAIHKLSKDYPSYNARETQHKINHYLESGTKPITCKTIADKGFKCPKLSDDSCGAKAPAALCYKPLLPEELRLFLKELVPTKVAVDDVTLAQGFVKDYLYNVDSVVAGTFIDFEIKEHFGLKASAMKPLISMQRDLYKAYKDSKETKRETSGDELPEWYEYTEKGGLRFIPGILAKHMSKNVCAFYGAENYYFYENGVYSEGSDLIATAKVREHLTDRYATMSGINDAEGQWKMLIYKPIREINCNPFIINVKNGLYNILDDSFKPHTPEYFSTVQINAIYDPSAKCTQFLKFLSGILNAEEICLVQEILGYLLIPVNKAQKSFVFVGAPNAGKSTLLSVAQEILLGSANVSNVPWQSLGDRFKTAEIFGKLANIFADLPSKSVDDNGIFKALTGEDYITAERKNKNPFSFKPYARLLFSCNEIPRNYGDRSDGFYRRLIIIRFDKSVPAAKRDANLREKLSVECDGILMWAIEGLKRLISNGYVFSETDRTRAELQRYKIESNSVLSFVDEFCEVKKDVESMRDELFVRYKEYCNNAGLKAVSQANFNKEIEGLGEEVERGFEKMSRRKTWKGIRFKD